MENKRTSEVSRNTNETQIMVSLNLDGSGEGEISTGVPFMDHMLELFSKHGFFDLEIKAKGDIDIDYHHLVEDLGITLGQAFSEALGEKAGIKRYGFFVLPMDETLVTVALDLSNRAFLVFDAPLPHFNGSRFQCAVIQRIFSSVRE
jgi:imidazoleglycerol-phosphate dehydratase